MLSRNTTKRAYKSTKCIHNLHVLWLFESDDAIHTKEPRRPGSQPNSSPRVKVIYESINVSIIAEATLHMAGQANADDVTLEHE